eukprot:gene2633-biopygen13376
MESSWISRRDAVPETFRVPNLCQFRAPRAKHAEAKAESELEARGSGSGGDEFGGWARGGPARRRGERSCAGKGRARSAQYQPRGSGGAAAAVSGGAASRLTYAICHGGAAVSDRRQQAPQGHVQPAPD